MKRPPRSTSRPATQASELVELVVIGASAGGIDALGEILPRLPRGYPLPMVIILHLPEHGASQLADIFRPNVALPVKEADEKERIAPGTIYFAPPGYHLLMERDRTFSLSMEAPVWFSRPSIDVAFESAAHAFGGNLLGVLLTGANEDGARGIQHIQQAGGRALVQDPESAQVGAMPRAAMELLRPSQVYSLDDIAGILAGLADPAARPVLSAASVEKR